MCIGYHTLLELTWVAHLQVLALFVASYSTFVAKTRGFASEPEYFGQTLHVRFL